MTAEIAAAMAVFNFALVIATLKMPRRCDTLAKTRPATKMTEDSQKGKRFRILGALQVGAGVRAMSRLLNVARPRVQDVKKNGVGLATFGNSRKPFFFTSCTIKLTTFKTRRSNRPHPQCQLATHPKSESVFLSDCLRSPW